MNYRQGNLKQLDAIYEELERRVVEGVPIANLTHNTIIYSIFNRGKTRLYSVPTEPFFHVFQENGVDMVRPQLNEIKPDNVIVNCFNIPPDMTNLQNFQRNIKPRTAFNNDVEFAFYYIQHLKEVFAIHASIDPSITTSFDLYIQSCKTGESFALHVPSHSLPSTIPKDLNYWETRKENDLHEKAMLTDST